MNVKYFRTIKGKITVLIAGMALYAGLILLVGALIRRPAERSADLGQRLQTIGNDLVRLDADRNAFLFHYMLEGNSLEAVSDQAEASARVLLQKTANEIDYLATFQKVRRDSGLASLQESLSVSYTGLSSNVNALFRAVRERGNTETGLISQWLDLGDEMAAQATVASDNEAAAALNVLGRLESAYLRDFSTRELEEIATMTEDMMNRSGLTESSLPMDVLGDYLVLTQKLIELNERISGENGGLLQQANAAAEKTMNDQNKLSSSLENNAGRSGMMAGIAGYAFLVLVFLAGAYVLARMAKRQISEPLQKINGYAGKLSLGILPENGLALQGGKELEDMSRNLNALAKGLRDKYALTRALNENNFAFKPELAGDEDIFGNELVSVRKKLVETTEEQTRNNEENARRRYINEGLASFAEILRVNNDNLTMLGDAFIRNMVNYLKAVQGGLFLLHKSESDENSLDLISAFAYDRKKFQEKSIVIGEGLIGTCAIEKTTMNLTEIPEGYISITSGLGDTPPQNLLLVPVMHEDELIGVVEVASMKKFRDFEIKFADEVAKSLAATILYTRNNERTNELLRKSQQQAVEMAEQEEEMRQNMEELKATQEESARREEEYRGMVKAIESSILVVEYDKQGKVSRANEKLCAFLGKGLKEIIGKTHREVFGTSFDPGSDFWDELSRESNLVRNETLEAGGKKEKLTEHFVSVVTESGELKKYMNFILRH